MNKNLKKIEKTRLLLTAPILIVLGLLGFGLYFKHDGVVPRKPKIKVSRTRIAELDRFIMENADYW